jgi:hypothetical protein
MNTNRKILTLGLIVLTMAIASSCKRDAVKTPSPVGPSSLATLLTVSANPNVIYAGSVRGTTVITATLKKFNGTPLSDKTVFFEIGDKDGNTLNVGFFEDQPAVASKITDGAGMVKVVYRGPLSEEITQTGAIYVWVSAAWEGAEFITERLALQILQEPIETWYLAVAVNPNVMLAGTERERASVIALLTRADGSPVPNKQVSFKVIDNTEVATVLNVGFFEDNKSSITKITDKQGMVSTRYYGPLSEEIDASQTVNILGIANFYGQAHVETKAPLQLIKGTLTSWILTVQAKPNVLVAGTTREESVVTATLIDIHGTPLANKSVTFKVADSTGAEQNVGYFDGGKTYYTKATDSQGQVRVRYYGPLASEITSSMTVYIWGTAGFQGQEFVEGNSPIHILQDLRTLTFDAAAYPSVLFATSERPKSTIRATVKLGAIPVKGRRVYFSILNNALGKFGNGNRSQIATTNDSGEASVTYLGPTKNEFNWEIGIYIRAQLETLGTEEMTFKDVYVRIKKQE